jgi:hypothetical protein
LTGRPAGVREKDGRFTEGSVNRLVEERLESYARIRHQFGPRALESATGQT